MVEVISLLEATSDQIITFVVLICLVNRPRRFKPALEASHSLWPAKSLLCDFHLNRWIEIQENGRNCKLELRLAGLKFTSFKLPCLL